MSFAVQRRKMVDKQLRARGIQNEAILAAFSQTPRHLFVDKVYHHIAYADTPIPIPAGQTISQPYIVAYMLQSLRPQAEDRVLEIGAGSGYVAAILSQLVRETFTVERHAELVVYAREKLDLLGCQNVQVRQGDGTLGWPEHAPYQGIVVAASGPLIPQALSQQLAVGGRLLMPVGKGRTSQNLLLQERHSEDKFTTDHIGAVRFVPLIGREGWQGNEGNE